jgi:hypothetical protein
MSTLLSRDIEEQAQEHAIVEIGALEGGDGNDDSGNEDHTGDAGLRTEHDTGESAASLLAMTQILCWLVGATILLSDAPFTRSPHCAVKGVSGPAQRDCTLLVWFWLGHAGWGVLLSQMLAIAVQAWIGLWSCREMYSVACHSAVCLVGLIAMLPGGSVCEIGQQAARAAEGPTQCGADDVRWAFLAAALGGALAWVPVAAVRLYIIFRGQ